METTQSNWTEARLQAECFQWHWNAYPDERGLLFTVDNNANDKVKGNIRKAVGRIAGVTDMIYLYQFDGRPRVYLIELKLPGEKQSKVQIRWEGLVCRLGFDYTIVDNLEQFKDLINQLRTTGYYLPF